MALKELVVLFQANATPAIRALDDIDRKLKSTSRRLNAAADSMFSFGKRASFFLTIPLLGLGAASISAQAKMQGMRATLTSILKEFKLGIPITEAVANEMQIMEDIAEELGVSLSDISRPYVKYLAASNDGIEVTRKVIKSFISLGTALQLTPPQLQSVVRAIEDMQSKGQVMAEDLKKQLGNTLPGAIKLFAQAAGVGTREFTKMSEAGEVSADLLSKVADLINTKFFDAVRIAAKKPSAEINRIRTGFFLLSEQIGIAQDEVFGVTEKLKFLGKWLKFTAKDLARLDAKGKKILFFFAAFLAGIGPVSIALAVLLRTLAFARAGFLLLISPVRLLFAALAFLAPGLFALGSFLLLNPLGLFLLATLLIVANWERLVKLFDKAGEKLESFTKPIKALFRTNEIEEGAPGVGARVKEVLGGLRDAALGVAKPEKPKFDLSPVSQAKDTTDLVKAKDSFLNFLNDFVDASIVTAKLADTILLGGNIQRGLQQQSVTNNLTVNVAPGTTAADAAAIRDSVNRGIEDSKFTTFQSNLNE